MNGIENAQHDISDASFCVDTAIELLSSIEHDRDVGDEDLQSIVRSLLQLKGGLDDTYKKLLKVANHYD